MLLEGRKLLVTGVLTESSIAFSIARRAQEEGAEIVLSGFGRGLRITQRVARRLPTEPDVLELDVNDPEQLDAVAAQLDSRWGRLDGLVHAIAFVPADALGGKFLSAPSSSALAAFLQRRREADPDAFADLSLSVVKLLGAGEYSVERPWEPEGEEGHFGLAVDDYSHTTAPNRRYADLVMQRLVKATLGRAPAPYSADELDVIAARCTEMENAARKVERTVRKVVAATLLQSRVGEMFDAIVTGVNQSGTFARLTHPPAEGRIVHGEHGLDVGDHVRVKLVDVNVAKGFVDFAKA